MKIGVIGAGAVGGTIAALFDRAGHDLEVTARGDNAAAIARDGIRLDGAFGEHLARVDVSMTLARRPELAFVTTKAQDAESAMRPAARILDGVPVVVVQNGLDGVRVARETLPSSHVLGALTSLAASFVSPGAVTVTASGGTVLGRANDLAGMPCLFAERALRQVMPVTSVEDFTGAQWTKLIVNQVNALPAITGLSVQEVVADRRLRAVLTASMQEAIRTGLARRVHFGALQGLTHTMLQIAARTPGAVAQFLPSLLARRMGDVPNPGSTLQSVRRGQPTEIDYLNGAVVRAAEEGGGSAPVNATLVRLVHEVEAGRPFLGADDVVAAVGGVGGVGG